MNRSSYFFACVVVSSLLHILLGELFLKIPQPQSDSFLAEKNNPVSIEVSLIPQHEYQIADIDKPTEEKRPKDARFLGDYDSSVKEEQVGMSGSEHKKKSGSSTPNEKTEKKGKETEKKEEENGEKKLEKSMGGIGGRENSPHDSRTDQAGPDLFGGDQDFFPDYKIGNQTYLNVFRFPKVSYFVRLKKILKVTWNPFIIRPYLSGVSGHQLQTVIAVTISRSGQLEELSVIQSSKLTPYDQEALRAFKDSSPFASPPENLLDNTGKLRIAYTFVFYF